MTVKKCGCNISAEIKVLNFDIKFSRHFKNSVKFVNLKEIKFIKFRFSTMLWSVLVGAEDE